MSVWGDVGLTEGKHVLETGLLYGSALCFLAQRRSDRSEGPIIMRIQVTSATSSSSNIQITHKYVQPSIFLSPWC